MSKSETFRESNLWSAPIKDLGLAIQGTPLEELLVQFEQEREAAGFTRLKPRFYLSSEWGVPTGTIAIAIPFYLARTDLTDIHAEETGFVEGRDRNEILRYLRHEFGHVVNYAYKLYEDEDWIRTFGSMTQPYLEDYRPVPFSMRHVVHLPGWYAQKHPDEDWAETFAVWMTPGRRWKDHYAGWPVALAKLECCDRLARAAQTRAPLVTATDLDEDVGETLYSLAQHYRRESAAEAAFPPGLDGALRAIFDDRVAGDSASKAAAALIRRLEGQLLGEVYRWTGHFPERTRSLLRHLAERATALDQVYPETREAEIILSLTALVTSLAMNYVFRGNYLP